MGEKQQNAKAARYDWNAARREYIESRQTTLLSLSEKTGAPSYSVIRTRARRENWSANKKAYWREKEDARSSSPERLIGLKAARYDWAVLRQEYIASSTLTFKEMAKRPGYPRASTISVKAASEGWSRARQEYQDSLQAKIAEETQRRVAKIASGAEGGLQVAVQGKLLKIGDAMLKIGVQALSHLEPQELAPVDIARFIKLGTDLQRSAVGLDVQTVEIGNIRSAEQLSEAPEAALWELIRMCPNGKREDDDDPLKEP